MNNKQQQQKRRRIAGEPGEKNSNRNLSVIVQYKL